MTTQPLSPCPPSCLVDIDPFGCSSCGRHVSMVNLADLLAEPEDGDPCPRCGDSSAVCARRPHGGAELKALL